MSANSGSGKEEEFNTDGHGFPRMDTDEMEKILTRMKTEWGANDRKSLPGDGMAHSPVTFYLLLSYLLPPEGRPRPFTFYLLASFPSAYLRSASIHLLPPEGRP